MIIRFRSRGEKVKDLQNLLGLKPDGIFGPNTLKALKNFQRDNGLSVDGIVGPNTWSVLVKNDKNRIRPIYDVDLNEEDSVSDPECMFFVEDIEETQPLSPSTRELINLIESSDITRNIKRLVFHCTATSQKATVSAIVNYWKNTLGWRSPGYHIIVRPDGTWNQLLDFNRVSNGVRGINSTTINISYIGGVDRNGKALDNRTKKQKDVYETIYRAFKHKLPRITFHGHNEFSSKACPSFNVKNWIKSLRVI
jgi:N-acetylmuramoyl-L-alanine amidase